MRWPLPRGGKRNTLRPDLAGTPDLIFEGGELFYPYWPTGMQLASGNANLRAKAKFTAIGKLGRGVMQDDG